MAEPRLQRRSTLDKIIYKPIGVIRTPFKTREDVPSRRKGRGVEGRVEIDPRYRDGLSDLEGFSHIYLIFHLHQSDGHSMRIVPHMETEKRGLFATRSPHRPNPVGVSLVRLKKIDGNVLHICDLDMVDGTPLLDIKPYVGELDPADDVRTGWLEGRTSRD